MTTTTTRLFSRAEALDAVARLVACYAEQKALKAALRAYVQVHGPVSAAGYTATFLERPTIAYPAAAVLDLVKGDSTVAPLMLNRTAVRPLLLPPSPYAEAIAALGIRDTYQIFELIPTTPNSERNFNR